MKFKSLDRWTAKNFGAKAAGKLDDKTAKFFDFKKLNGGVDVGEIYRLFQEHSEEYTGYLKTGIELLKDGPEDFDKDNEANLKSLFAVAVMANNTNMGYTKDNPPSQEVIDELIVSSGIIKRALLAAYKLGKESK